MHTREENGWSVPFYETKLSGSCRPSFHVHYRDWDKIKTTIFSIPDQERHTFIDAGANIGLISVPAKQYFKQVHAIEPEPITATCLKYNMDTDTNGMTSGKHFVYQAAAGRKKDRIELFSPPEPDTSGYMTTTKHTRWHAKTVDQMCIDALGLVHCDFVKLDVQGAEMDVIIGAEQTIRMYKPFIYIETKESYAPMHVLKEWGYEQLYSFAKGHEVLQHKRRRLK